MLQKQTGSILFWLYATNIPNSSILEDNFTLWRRQLNSNFRILLTSSKFYRQSVLYMHKIIPQLFDLRQVFPWIL